MDELLDALGVQVVDVPDLSLRGAWVRPVRVLLVRSGLNDEDRAEVIDWGLLQACGA